MDLALISIVALLTAIIVGVVRSDINVGAIALAFVFAIGLATPEIGVANVASLLPWNLLLMLIGVTLLFGMARENGTLEWLAQIAVVAARGKQAILPFLFFLITFCLSAIGPGNIAATAVIAPIGMAVAAHSGVNPMLMAIMICTGANAGAFSPMAPTGVINMDLLRQIGIEDGGVSLRIFLTTAALQSITALIAWIIFGRRKERQEEEMNRWLADQTIDRPSSAHIATILAVGALIVAVLAFDVPIVAMTFIVSFLLALPGFGSIELGIKRIPWGVIILIAGVSALIQMMERTGGIELATSLMTRYAVADAINGTLAFTTGILSTFSSSSGVVVPLYIPLLPSLASGVGVNDLVSMAIAVDIGSHMVDVSPLSSLGALCLAAVENETERNLLFKRLLLWGLAMALVGGALAFLFLDLL